MATLRTSLPGFLGAGILVGAAFFAGRASVAPEEPLVAAAPHPAAPALRAKPGAVPPTAPPVQPEFAQAAGGAPADWRELRAQPGSEARSTRLAVHLETLARMDPARALALAAAEPNLILREALVQASLRGWADVAPAAAATWAVALGDATKRGQAMATVFGRVALNDPAEAVRLGHVVFQQDPGGATGHACALANALCAAGRFDVAAGLAAGAGELGDVGRSILTVQTYAAWSRLQPEEAARAASGLADPAARRDALQAVVSGWGEADPAGLTQFVAQLAVGSERAPLLGQALRQWANLDSPAATAWVKNNEARLGADEGVAALVSAGGFVPPEIAAEWAEGIALPPLRSQTVLTLLRLWANTDPAAAERYFARTTALAAADRRLAAELFAPPAGP